jgi:flavin reductase (DIM6/NTAB) family NADH-FMN oxidoreductase RutF
MHYRPGKDDHGLALDPFKSCTVPRPIGWLSTVSAAGIANLAPYSQWQNLTFDPPLVMFAANQTVDGRRKDTVVNAEETGWFVWNMATYDLREAVNASASSLLPEEDEFEFAGVAKGDCIDAPAPLVADSPLHFECRYRTTLRFPGNSAVGTVDVVFGEVVRIHIPESAILDDGKLDILKIRPIARMGYYDYTTVDNLFEMRIPNATAAHLAGLEGRPTAPGDP